MRNRKGEYRNRGKPIVEAFYTRKAEIIKDYQMKVPVREIAKKYGVARQTINTWLHIWGVLGNKERESYLAQSLKSSILYDYKYLLLTQKQISRKYGLSEMTVRRWIMLWGESQGRRGLGIKNKPLKYRRWLDKAPAPPLEYKGPRL